MKLFNFRQTRLRSSCARRLCQPADALLKDWRKRLVTAGDAER